MQSVASTASRARVHLHAIAAMAWGYSSCAVDATRHVAYQPKATQRRRKTNLVVDQHVARLAVPVDDAVRVQERKRDDQFRERRHTRVKRTPAAF